MQTSWNTAGLCVYVVIWNWCGLEGCKQVACATYLDNVNPICWLDTLARTRFFKQAADSTTLPNPNPWVLLYCISILTRFMLSDVIVYVTPHTQGVVEKTSNTAKARWLKPLKTCKGKKAPSKMKKISVDLLKGWKYSIWPACRIPRRLIYKKSVSLLFSLVY